MDRAERSAGGMLRRARLGGTSEATRCICIHLWLKFLAYLGRHGGPRHRSTQCRQHATDFATRTKDLLRVSASLAVKRLARPDQATYCLSRRREIKTTMSVTLHRWGNSVGLRVP